MKEFTNPIHQAIYEQVVAPALSQKKDLVRAWVISYDHINNEAKVEYASDNSEQMHTLNKVPVRLVGGMKFAGPFPGDEVWVQFLGGNVHLPKIVAIADESHDVRTRQMRNKHTGKGAFVPDSICTRRNT